MITSRSKCRPRNNSSTLPSSLTAGPQLSKGQCNRRGLAICTRAVFTNATGAALTRFGIYKIIRRSTKQIVKKLSDGRAKPISPHVWRHSTAVHLLEAGVEVNVIRAWLGHASLETTNRYAESTLRTKRAALEKCTLSTSPDERIPRKPRWHTDASLLDWLKSL